MTPAAPRNGPAAAAVVAPCEASALNLLQARQNPYAGGHSRSPSSPAPAPAFGVYATAGAVFVIRHVQD
jgi:hypothetical protein